MTVSTLEFGPRPAYSKHIAKLLRAMKDACSIKQDRSPLKKKNDKIEEEKGRMDGERIDEMDGS